MKLDKILLPIDFSAHGYEGLLVAERLAHQAGATLLLVHVLDPSGKHGDWPTTKAARHLLEQQLHAIQPTAPNLVIEHALLEGETANQIVRYARRKHVDLIVMGSHGRTGLARVLMGSVAEEVLTSAPCPLLSVRPRIRLRGDIKAWAHR